MKFGLSKDTFLNKEKRYKLQLLIVSTVFFLAGTVFSILNIIKNEHTLLIVTSIFAGLSLLIIILTLALKKGRAVLELLFVGAALIMFSYFLIYGGAGDNGFSTYWILLLPFLAMLVLGLIKGSIATGIMFLIIVFFLWIPFGKSLLQWKPDSTFTLRFPLVYLAAFASSFLFELSRFFMEKQTDELTKRLESNANHDFLTGCTNRQGLQKIIEEYKQYIGTKEFRSASCMLIDIDNFKGANDNYGHGFGDEVLISLANILKKYCGDWAVRFGGDEFVLLFKNKTDAELRQIAEAIRKEALETTFASHPEYRYTICIGIASSRVDENYRAERVIELADYQSSRAKRNGKNMVYSINFDQLLEEEKKNKKNKTIFG